MNLLEIYEDKLPVKAAAHIGASIVKKEDISRVLENEFTSRERKIIANYRRAKEALYFRDRYLFEDRTEQDVSEVREYFENLTISAAKYFEKNNDKDLYLIQDIDKEVVGLSMPGLFSISYENIPESCGKAFVLEEDLKTITIVNTVGKMKDVCFTNIQDKTQEFWFDGSLYTPNVSTKRAKEKGRRTFYSYDNPIWIAIENKEKLAKGEPLEPDGLEYGEQKEALCEMQKSIAVANEFLQKEGTLTACKTCGNIFVLYNNEAEWFRSRGLVPPRRCESCRRKRREQQKNV